MEWKSVGMMTFQTKWNNNPTVPNHQPELYWKLHKPWDGIGWQSKLPDLLETLWLSVGWNQTNLYVNRAGTHCIYMTKNCGYLQIAISVRKMEKKQPSKMHPPIPNVRVWKLGYVPLFQNIHTYGCALLVENRVYPQMAVFSSGISWWTLVNPWTLRCHRVSDKPKW